MKQWIVQLKWSNGDWMRGAVAAPSYNDAIKVMMLRCPDAEVDIIIAGETPALVP